MTNKRLTAAEAREIAGPTPDEYVDEALILIKQAAENKQRKCCLTGSFWCMGGYNGTPDWEKACDILGKLGYEVDFFYEELQLVNMYTTVEW